MKKNVFDVQNAMKKILNVLKCPVFIVMEITLQPLMIASEKFEREVIETANIEYISIGSAKRKVMGANRSETSSYAAALKKIKTIKRKPNIVNRVDVSKISTPPQSRPKGESSNLNSQLRQSRSVTKVESSTTSLARKTQHTKSVSPKKRVPSGLKTDKASPSESAKPVSAESSLDSNLDAPEAISLPELGASSSEKLESGKLIVVEVHRSEGMETEAVRSKRYRTPSSSPPVSPLRSDYKKREGRSLEDLSVLRSSSSPKSKKDAIKNPKQKNSLGKPNLSRTVCTGSGARSKIPKSS